MINIPSSMTPDGNRIRRFFPTRDEARGFAEQMRAQYKNEGVAALGLSAEERVTAAKAFDLIRQSGIADLLEVVRDGIKSVKAKSQSKPLGEVFQLYIDSKKRSEIYSLSLQRSQRRLGDLANTLAAEVSPTMLEELLLGLQPSYRNSLMREMRAVFTFAQKKKWCRENPVKEMEFDSLHVGEREVFSVDESARLLYTCATKHKDLLPFVATGLFAGVRVFEMLRMNWESIDLREQSIDLPAKITKRKRQRSIEIEPVLRIWLKRSLELGIKHEGPLLQVSTYDALRDRIRELAKDSKVVWKQNALRHSYASYWLAKHGDLDRLSLQLGHAGGLEVLQRFYHRAVKEKTADTFWKLTPRCKAVKKLALEQAEGSKPTATE